jgi:hypothetical protein
MVENIFAGVLCAIAVVAAVWGWWLENGSNIRKTNEDISEKKREDA